MLRLGLISAFTAIACLSSAAAVSAQSEGPPAAVDPPDTDYATGAQDPDAAVERRLAVVPVYRGFLPVAADLSVRMPPVINQAALPASAAFAAAYAARSAYTVLEGRDISEPANQASPGFVYHLARQGGCEDGTSIPRVVDVLRRGALSLADYPYAPDCAPPAPPSVVAGAHGFRVQGLRRFELKRIDDIKGELSRLNPIVVEFQVSPAFKHYRGDATFAEPGFDAGSKDNGRQFVTLVGYDDGRQAFRLINSWGIGWGDHGYAWLGYDAFKARVSRAYVLEVAGPRRATSQPVDSKSPPTPAPKPDLAELKDLACAQIRVQTDGDHRVVSGFVASDADLKAVNRIAAGATDITVGDVTVLPWPLCEAMLTLDKALTAADQPKIVTTPDRDPREGDNLAIEIRSPAREAFLYVTYVQADGSIVNLTQPKPQAAPLAAGTTATFGDGKDGRPKFLVSRPFGREMVIAIAARDKLFEEALPTKQPARDYLSALRRGLIARRADGASGAEPSAAVKILTTQAK